jgi:hypothetical protein
MTSPDAKTNPAPEDLERIAAELAALGEDPLADEGDAALAFALGDAPDIDIATVQVLGQTAAGWADAEAELDTSEDHGELSELAQARVWRTIELRTTQSEAPAEAPARQPSKRPLLLGTLGTLGTVVALFAAAAAVVLVPVLNPSDTPGASEGGTPVAQTSVTPEAAPSVTAEELDVLSTQARASLAALDRLSGEPRGSARAAAMADAYARRLEAEG